MKAFTCLSNPGMIAYSTCPHVAIAYSEYDLSDQDEDELLFTRQCLDLNQVNIGILR